MLCNVIPNGRSDDTKALIKPWNRPSNCLFYELSDKRNGWRYAGNNNYINQQVTRSPTMLVETSRFSFNQEQRVCRI